MYIILVGTILFVLKFLFFSNLDRRKATRGAVE